MISVVIPHHLNENQGYLDLCLKGVMASICREKFEVWVVADCPVTRVRFFGEKPDPVQVYVDIDLNTAQKKLHYAIDNLIDKDSTHVLYLSDDVLIAKDCMQSLYDVSQMNVITNPQSNNDLGSVFFTPMKVRDLNIKVKMNLEDVKGYEDDIMNQVGPEFILPRPWVPFFCTMIPLKIWRELGGLDHSLKCRHDDEDFCLRAQQKGYPSMINMRAFALHFGDKTLPKVWKEQDYMDSTNAFKAKWEGKIV